MTRDDGPMPSPRTSVRHLGITTPNLRQTEDYYRDQFGMEPMFRETLLDDGHWHTLPDGFGWDDAIGRGVDIGMVALGGPGFVLALFQEDAPEERLTVVGLVVSASALSEFQVRFAKGADVEGAQPSGAIEFVDPLGITWQITDEDQFLSNGEANNRWLEV